jgi:hypothetical protein
MNSYFNVRILYIYENVSILMSDLVTRELVFLCVFCQLAFADRVLSEHHDLVHY